MKRLSPLSSAAIAEVSADLRFRRGELVYREGEPATGAYMVTAGKLKLLATSSEGKAVMLRIASTGDIIGLSAALSGSRNDTNAQALEPAAVCYLKTDSLYRLMSCYNEISLWLAEQLSIEYFSLCRELSLLGLRRSAMSKLATLLAALFEKGEFEGGAVRVSCPLTHEEMAQIIGTSRETVTRLLRQLRETTVVTFKGHMLCVNNLDRLRALTH